MIETTYTLTEAEFVEAQSILLRVAQKKFMTMRIWLSGILLISLAEPLITRTATWRLYLDVRILFVFVLLLLLLFFPLIQSRGSRKQFAKVRDAFTNFHLRLDETGYMGESPGLANGHMNWNGFTNWREGRNVITLIRENMGYPIPKHAFSKLELDELRRILAANIADGPKRRT